MANINTPELCRTRFARLTIIAANIYSKMMREIALKNVQPEVTYIIIKTNPALYGILNADEKRILETLNSEKYNLCDAGLLYKIIRHILPEPTNGWVKSPGFNDLKITDDIERVRLLRNKIFHRPQADITELEELDTTKDVLEIAGRVDQYLKKNSNEGFKKEVTDLSSCSLDPKLEGEYVELGLEVERLRRKETIMEGGMTLHLTTGKKLEVFIADVLLRDLQGYGHGDTCKRVWRDESHTEGSLLIRLGVKMKSIRKENDLTRHTGNFIENILSDSNRSRVKRRHCKEIEVILSPVEQDDVASSRVSCKPHQSSVITMRQLINVKDSADLTDCLILGNQLLFTDSISRKIIIYNINGTFNREFILKEKPWCLTEIENDIVAVTYPFGHSIQFIRVSSGLVLKMIDFGKGPWGISYYDGLIYESSGVKSLHVLDIDGNKIRAFPLPTSFVRYITIQNERIFCTDDETFYCCDLFGNIKWTFKNDKMKLPRGITTDENGKIYVASYQSGNVIEVSPKGEFLSDIYGLEWPTGIFYHKTNDRLLVCNQFNSKAFLYDVKNMS